MQVFPTTYALEIFATEGGEIAMKQADQYGDEDDVILIPVIHVEAVIRALRAAKRDALGG